MPVGHEGRQGAGRGVIGRSQELRALPWPRWRGSALVSSLQRGQARVKWQIGRESVPVISHNPMNVNSGVMLDINCVFQI